MGNYIRKENFIDIVDMVMANGGLKHELNMPDTPIYDAPRRTMKEARELIRELKRMKKW